MTKEEANFIPLTSEPLKNIEHSFIVSNWAFRATPHFSQMAVALPRLFAQIHHISAYGLWGNRNFCEVLLTVTEVNCQEHRHHFGPEPHGSGGLAAAWPSRSGPGVAGPGKRSKNEVARPAADLLRGSGA